MSDFWVYDDELCSSHKTYNFLAIWINNNFSKEILSHEFINLVSKVVICKVL
jgi:hypothetical protein